MILNATTTLSGMWENEDYKIKLRQGLALAEKRMLKQKALNNAPVIQSLPNGEIIEASAAQLLEDYYGYHINKTEQKEKIKKKYSQ